jgi:hypothetical protein
MISVTTNLRAIDQRKIKSTIDEKSITIYKYLLDEHQFQCKENGTQVTLVGVFFHDLQKILSSFIFRTVEFDFGLALPQVRSVKCEQLPYIDFYDIQSRAELDLATKNFGVKANSTFLDFFNFRWLAQKLLEVGSGLINPRGKKLAVLEFQGDVKLVCIELVRLGYRLYFPNKEPKLYIKNYESQLQSLAKVVERLGQQICVNSQFGELYRICDAHIRNRLKHQPDSLAFDYLLTGTLCKLENRAIAATHFEDPACHVVTVHHGYASSVGVFNEPVFGYGECAYANVIVHPGKASSAIEPQNYNHPMTSVDRFQGASSEFLAKIFQPTCSIPKLSSLTNPKFMYVPTSFSGLETYGPFRSISDFLYFDWQLFLQSAVRDLVIKIHPKGYTIEPESRINLIREPFQRVYEQADVFIFDYISSSFSIAAATSKPIIFFDVGVRNLTGSALEKIKKRCMYIDLRHKWPCMSATELWQCIDEKCDQQCENEYTPEFSVDDSLETIDETVISIFRGFLE